MSKIGSIIDSEGNINASFLTKELHEALQDDVKYKQTDNMKKRAVKVSTDYNEFKAMVACAHLKKLTSKEVESLSHVKKGWQKSAPKDKSETAIILTKEQENEELTSKDNEIKTIFKTMSSKSKPKSAMEIERDLRRIPNEQDRLLYLYRVGLKRAKSLLISSGDTDLLEKIMILLTWNKNNLIQHYQTIIQKPKITKQEDNFEMLKNETEERKPDNIEDSIEKININNNEEKHEKTEEELLYDIKIRAKWLATLSECEKFELTVRFLSQELLHNIIDIFHTIIHNGSNSNTAATTTSNTAGTGSNTATSSSYDDAIMKYSTGLRI